MNAAPRSRVTLLLMLASSVTLVVALFLPTVRFKALGSEEEIYSIVGGIVSLWEGETWWLAPIVLAFSVVWPLAKLVLLFLIWGRAERGRGSEVLRALRFFGKWSLLDVFVIALFVGSMRLGILADAESRAGIQVFLVAIALSMAASMTLASELGTLEPLAAPRATTAERLLNLFAIAALALACVHPIFELRKALLFSKEVDLVSSSTELWSSEERFLGATIAVFVLGTTALRTLLLVWMRWSPSTGKRSMRAFLILDEWSMLDVFALGMAIVATKLAELATTTRLEGFWWVLAAALVADADATWFRRRSHRALRS